MSEPSSSLVRAFWAHMTQRFQTKVVSKSSAAEMAFVSSFLDQLGIVDKDHFLRDYATTISRRIYLPFEPGVPSAAWPLWEQIVVGVHEHQHVVQSDDLGFVVFGARYLTNKAQRARFEAEAYRSTLEMSWWRFRSLPDPAALAQKLAGYGVDALDIKVTAAYLAASAASIKQGAIVNRSSAVALAWLNQHAPELRAA